jgi:hypothetical protein
MDFLITTFLYLVVTMALKKSRSSIGLEIHKVTLLPPSHPLQAILLGELVGCGTPLQIILAICWNFF